ncbi:protein of unknown function [Burkholderia multivorans]
MSASRGCRRMSRRSTRSATKAIGSSISGKISTRAYSADDIECPSSLNCPPTRAGWLMRSADRRCADAGRRASSLRARRHGHHGLAGRYDSGAARAARPVHRRRVDRDLGGGGARARLGAQSRVPDRASRCDRRRRGARGAWRAVPAHGPGGLAAHRKGRPAGLHPALDECRPLLRFARLGVRGRLRGVPAGRRADLASHPAARLNPGHIGSVPAAGIGAPEPAINGARLWCDASSHCTISIPDAPRTEWLSFRSPTCRVSLAALPNNAMQ